MIVSSHHLIYSKNPECRTETINLLLFEDVRHPNISTTNSIIDPVHI